MSAATAVPNTWSARFTRRERARAQSIFRQLFDLHALRRRTEAEIASAESELRAMDSRAEFGGGA